MTPVATPLTLKALQQKTIVPKEAVEQFLKHPLWTAIVQRFGISIEPFGGLIQKELPMVTQQCLEVYLDSIRAENTVEDHWELFVGLQCRYDDNSVEKYTVALPVGLLDDFSPAGFDTEVASSLSQAEEDRMDRIHEARLMDEEEEILPTGQYKIRPEI